MPEKREWNSRFVAYAKSNSRTPEEESDHGQNMIGFMLWVNARWEEWINLTGHPASGDRSAEIHRAFDAWLDVRHYCFASSQPSSTKPN